MSTVLSVAPIVNRFNDTNARDVMDYHRRATPRQIVQTICTEYVGPTDCTGSAIRASDVISGRIHFEAMQYDLTTPENHLNAALGMLREFYQFSYQLINYESTDSGYQFAFVQLENGVN